MKAIYSLSLLFVVAFSSQSFAKADAADCVKGKITLTENGPSLLGPKGIFIGTVANPHAFHEGETGSFKFVFENSGIAGNQAFVTVQKVRSCN